MVHETVASLAELVGGEVEGDASIAIRGVADLRAAAPDQIGFLRGTALLDAARTTRAGALLVTDRIDTKASQIVVKNVYAAFAKVAQRFHPAPPVEAHVVHPTAVVAADAKLETPVAIGPHVVVEAGVHIGAGTTLHAGVVIGARSRIGKGCTLHPRVVLYPGVQIGDRVILHAGCVLGSDGFGYAPDDNGRHIKFPQMGTVIVEEDVEIGANTTIDRGALGATRIGKRCKLDNLIHVGHNCTFGEDTVVAGFSAFSGSTQVGNRVTIAGHVVMAGHLKVADDVRIGGNSTVHMDVTEPGDYLGFPLQEMRRFGRTLHVMGRLVDLRDEVRDLRRQVKELRQVPGSDV